jgi:hypothetical protein
LSNETTHLINGFQFADFLQVYIKLELKFAESVCRKRVEDAHKTTENVQETHTKPQKRCRKRAENVQRNTS